MVRGFKRLSVHYTEEVCWWWMRFWPSWIKFRLAQHSVQVCPNAAGQTLSIFSPLPVLWVAWKYFWGGGESHITPVDFVVGGSLSHLWAPWWPAVIPQHPLGFLWMVSDQEEGPWAGMYLVICAIQTLWAKLDKKNECWDVNFIKCSGFFKYVCVTESWEGLDSFWESALTSTFFEALMFLFLHCLF